MSAFDYSSLIGGAIAGLMVLAVREIIYFFKNKADTKRELEGLMVLLAHEIEHNIQYMQLMLSYSEDQIKVATAREETELQVYLPMSVTRTLRSKAWEDSRAKLAYLINSRDIQIIARHYSQSVDLLRWTHELGVFEDGKHSKYSLPIVLVLTELIDQGKETKRVVDSYITEHLSAGNDGSTSEFT